jgi:O-antigen/teichoic acid export membrane protein
MLKTISKKWDSIRISDSIYERIKFSVFWYFVATVFNQGSTFLINIAVARITGIVHFGEYAIVLNTLMVVSGLAQLSIGYTATKYVSEFRTSDKVKTGKIIGVCSIFSIITSLVALACLLLFSNFIARLVLKTPSLENLLFLGAGFFFFSSFIGYQMGALSGFEAFKRLASAGIISGIIAFGLVFAGAYWFGVKGAVLMLSFSAAIRCLVHYWHLRKILMINQIKATYSGLAGEKGILTRFAVPATLAGYLTIVSSWGGNAILTRQNNGLVEMAFFAAASNFRVLILFIPNILHSVSMTILNHIKGSDTEANYKRLIKWNIAVIFAAALICAVIVSFFSKNLLGLFGKEFSSSYIVFIVLLLSTIPESLGVGLCQNLVVNEKMWQSLWFISIPRESLYLLLAFCLIPGKGAVGLAWAYWIVSIFVAGMAFYLFQKNSVLKSKTQEPPLAPKIPLN